MSRGKVIVTGATGYVGKRVVEALKRDGWSAEAWTRTKPESDIAWQRYALTDEALPSASGAVAIIHLAADTSGATDASLEHQAAERLARAARDADARLIFASSQTALNPASAYGRAKRDIEAIVDEAGGVSARLGLVFGRRQLGGVFATLAAVTRRLPLLPAILPAPRVQPIHVDDVADALVRIVDLPEIKGVVHLGEAPAPFHTFLSEIARRRHGRSVLFMPIPHALILPAVSVLPLAVRERAHSLLKLAPMPSEDARDKLGLELRPWRRWLGASVAPIRRDLVREGRALLWYAGGHKPPSSLVRRYVRAIETLAGGAPLNLPNAVYASPWLLGLIEQPHLRGQSALETRLDWALSLAEATPEGARAFERAPRFLGAGLDVFLAVCGEVSRRVFGPLTRLAFGVRRDAAAP